MVNQEKTRNIKQIMWKIVLLTNIKYHNHEKVVDFIESFFCTVFYFWG